MLRLALLLLFSAMNLFPAPAASQRVAIGKVSPGEPLTVSAPFPFRGLAVYSKAADAPVLTIRASGDVHPVLWENELGERIGSDLIWFDEPQSEVEVRAESGDTSALELFFIEPDGSRAKAIPLPRSGAAPSIVPRGLWGCSPQICPTRAAPSYSPVTHLVVHHSAGTNSATDWPAVVKAIWTMHVMGNGWNDIGYNYLIDPTGLIYEGRAGGDGVLGAHFSGVNFGTSGISLLGTFSAQRPAGEALASLNDVLGWLADRWNLDTASIRHHSQSNLWLNSVAGHRDAGISPSAISRTECPGNGLYPLLTEIRSKLRTAREGTCGAAADLPRCVRATAGAVEFGVSLPGGCTLGAPVVPAWTRLENLGSNRFRLNYNANPAGERRATLRIAGRDYDLIQAAAGASALPCPVRGGVIPSAAASALPATPLSIVSIFGSDLAASTAQASSANLPQSLDGVEVLINGRPSPLFFVSPGQINFQLPTGTPIGSARLSIRRDSRAGPETLLSVTEAAPALYTHSGRMAIAVNAEDGQLNTQSPAQPGSVIVAYLNGGGPVAANVPQRATLPFSARIGDLPADVAYLGLTPGSPGLYQANIVVPEGLPAGTHPLVITIAGASSDAAQIVVR